MADSPRIEELIRRVHSDPASIAFAALAEEYRRAGRFEEAIQTCVTGLQRHPSYLSAHVTLGRALIEVGRYEDAREELELVLRAAPENLAAIRGLAEIHHRRGESHDETARYDALPAQPAAPPARAPAEATRVLAPDPHATAASLPSPGAASEAPAEGVRWKLDLDLPQPPPPPAADPVLEGLEALLAAIARAREGGGTIPRR